MIRWAQLALAPDEVFAIVARTETPPEIPADGPVSLGAALRARRWSQGLSLQEFAARTGFSRSHLSHVETDADEPSPLMLETLATTLGLSSDELKMASPAEVREWMQHGLRLQSQARSRQAEPSMRSGAFRRGAGISLQAEQEESLRKAERRSKLVRLSAALRDIAAELEHLANDADA